MSTNSDIIKDSSLCNSINSRGFFLANKGLLLDRNVMVSNYTQETIHAVWECLSINVIQNYQRGKGTYIKGLGTFTYKGQEINLEGTTNQYIRDKKPKIPVFIVSKEYNSNLCAGEYTKQNGIRYFIQKQSQDISIIKLNLAEIAYSISMSKDEVSNLLKNLILILIESIVKKNFKNKILPGLGTIVVRNNIVAVNFNENFCIMNKYKNYKNTFTKKNILMDMDMENAQNVAAADCETPYQNIEDLKAKNALITKCDQSAQEYLKYNYDTDIKKFPKSERKNIYNNYNNNKGFKFINDNVIKENLKNKKNLENENSLLNILDDETLKSLEYFKGVLIKNCKNFDIDRSGVITKENAVNAILMSNINNKINSTIAQNLINFYNKTDNVEYMKFIAQLVKDSHLTLFKNNAKNFNNNLKSTDFNNFKREKFFGNTSNNFNTNNKLRKSGSCVIERENKKNNEPLRHSNSNSNLIKSQTMQNFFNNRQKETDYYRKQLSNILNILPEIRRKYYTCLDQKISSNEFWNILNNYNISHPKKTLESILTYIGIQDISAFSLREFEKILNNCKILIKSVSSSEIYEIIKKLKDIIYINGSEKFFFNNEINPKNTVNCETFIKLFKNKNCPYDSELLSNIFYYLVKTDRDFNLNDYKNYFDNPENKINYDETMFLSMMQKLMLIVSTRNLKPDEYFDFLISFNKSTKNKVITRLNWITYLQNEKMNFSAEALDNLFQWIDTKKDNVIDREEFLSKFDYTLRPLTNIKNIIKENKLDIEDLAHRMKIPISELMNYDYENFKKKIKLLDYTFPEEMILKTYNELISKKIGNENKEINSKKFLNEINYDKNYNSFTQNYMDTIRKKISHDNLKNKFEKLDKDFLGTLTKLEYVLAVSNILPEFNDQDHMMFLRVTDMFDSNENVKYTELLNLIYYYSKEKLNDPFSNLCLILSNLLSNKCDNDIEKLMYLIDTGIAKKKNTLIVHKPLTIKQISNFLKNIPEKKINIPEMIIQKLDIDADGLVSFEDLRAVLKRYIHTSFFKYTNDSKNPNINLYSKEVITETKFKEIIKKLHDYMKSKNITEVGLFRKFDLDNDGFISNIDFNTAIGEILPMSPAMKDQLFNYFDFYHNGLIDLNTFNVGLEGFPKNNILLENNNKIENEILQKLKEFILKNNKMSDNEIFEVLDKNCDGLICINDFKKFLINNLSFSEKDCNKAKLERVMMSLSLSKNLQIGLNDIREFINLCNENREHMNLKEVFKITTNQNLSELKKNKEWTNDIIERLGMYVSEKYDSIEQFFNENCETGSNKLKFCDFLKYHEKNSELFNNGFNLTNDELMSIFTSLDSHKKNYLTLQDLKNKLQIFNFYNKMHIDVKNFIKENFHNGIDAFKFFIKSKNEIEKTDPGEIDINDQMKCSITLKEFFDAFENFFPGKYATNTILKYLNKYFNISIPGNKNNLINKKDTISFSEFNYIYFDTVKSNNSFINKKILDTKLMTNRQDISNKLKNDLINNPQNNFYYSNLFKKKFQELSTPFDNDPLTKIKRIVCSSKYNLNNFFEKVKAECGNENYIVNKYQFRNIIKSLDIGLTNLEIDQIMFKCGKVSYDGNLNLKEFINFLYNQNSILSEGQKNISPIISEIKSLIYKYYSNPIICFNNNDIKRVGKIDFERFKNIVFDMYNRNEQKLPNFTLIKNAFDTIDLRKDGLIDMNEWTKVFGSFNGKLDIDQEKISYGVEYFDSNLNKNLPNLNSSYKKLEKGRKILREWETSSDISLIYKIINKNKKIIKQRILNSNYCINNDDTGLIQPDNFVKILKETLPNINLNMTQWKMIVNVAKKETLQGLIDVNEFFRLMELSTKNLVSHPSIHKQPKLTKSLSDYSILKSNNINIYNNLGYKTCFGNRKFSMNKKLKNSNLSSMNITNADFNSFLKNNKSSTADRGKRILGAV